MVADRAASLAAQKVGCGGIRHAKIVLKRRIELFWITSRRGRRRRRGNLAQLLREVGRRSDKSRSSRSD